MRATDGTLQFTDATSQFAPIIRSSLNEHMRDLISQALSEPSAEPSE